MNTDRSSSAEVLVGNVFPLSLVRRKLVIEPVSIDIFRAALRGKTVRSFWGHASTLAAVNRFLGTDLTPATARPALVCDQATGLPSLDGHAFSECWVISPEYEAGFRPAIGAEVPPEKILGWQVLRMRWEDVP